MIAGITAQAEALRQAELAKTIRRMNPSASDLECLEALTQALVRQLLHAPIATLRERALHSDPAPLEAARALFQLEHNEPDLASPGQASSESAQAARIARSA